MCDKVVQYCLVTHLCELNTSTCEKVLPVIFSRDANDPLGTLDPLLLFFKPDPEMAAVPFGVHAAQKVRHSMNLEKSQTLKHQESSWDNKKKSQNWKDFFGTNQHPKKMMPYGEQQLTKYSDKMMNSIWGLYNRYSVHNLKSITAEEQAVVYGHYGFASFASFLNEVQNPGFS